MNIDSASIKIVNLSLRTIIGFNDWEREKKQDVLINITVFFDPLPSTLSDSVDDSLNYKSIKQKVIDLVENTHFNLLERLTSSILETVLSFDKVLLAVVRVDKPHALRFAESVSIEMIGSK